MADPTRPAEIRRNRDPTRPDPRVHSTRGQLCCVYGSARPARHSSCSLSIVQICANRGNCSLMNWTRLRLVRRSLTEETSEALVRSFIHSRLDNCSAVLAGQPDYVYKRLQSVLRSAARLVLKLASRDSVTDLMRDRLHWLCFPYRVTFQTLRPRI